MVIAKLVSVPLFLQVVVVLEGLATLVTGGMGETGERKAETEAMAEMEGMGELVISSLHP